MPRRLSRRGRRLNKMCEALCSPAERDAFKRDEEAFMTRFKLTDEEKDLMRKRDFKGLIELGGHPYLVAQLSRLLFGTANNRNTSTAAEMLRRSVVP